MRNHAAGQVVGYVRVSTDDGALKTPSVDSQTALIRADADSKGQHLVEIFYDRGASGCDEGRTEFNRMLSFVEDEANCILEIKISSRSRFTRDLDIRVQTLARLERAGVKMVSITQTFGDDSSGKLMPIILGLFDEYLAVDASNRSRRAMRCNAQQGFYNGGPLPFGYESRTVERQGDKDRKKLFIVGPEATVVCTIFRLATVGDGSGPLTSRAISDWLHERGYTHRSKSFNNNKVARILDRKLYTGHLFEQGSKEDGRSDLESDWVRIECPAIIDRATFEDAASLRAARAPRAR